MIPIADTIYEHCNGTQGLFWWEYPTLFNLISMVLQVYFVYCLDCGKIEFTLPTFTIGHKVLFMFLIWTGGCRWMLTQFTSFLWTYGQYKAGPYYIRVIRWIAEPPSPKPISDEELRIARERWIQKEKEFKEWKAQNNRNTKTLDTMS
jgi:hypothetical protein